MESMRQIKVTLPAELARLIDEKVASGEYETESAVVQDGLALLLEQDPAFETWLRTEGAAAYDAIEADPLSAISSDEVRAQLAALHRATNAAT